MRTIVTGSAGFIGSHLTESLLDAGHDVIGVDAFRPHYSVARRRENLTAALTNSSFELAECDVASIDPSILDGVDVVFHLAGRPGVRDSWGDTFDIYVDDNIRATRKLLDTMVATGVPRLVLASSSSVYGELGNRSKASEDDACRPKSPYGVTKLAAERLAVAYQDSFGIDVAALRYFTIYGPRQRPDMAIQKFIEAGLRGDPIEIYGDGEQRRDVTFVGDCVQATVAAAEIEPGVYNVAGGSIVSLNDIIDVIESAIGHRFDRHYTAVQAGDVRVTSADVGRIRATGVKAITSLADGIEQQVTATRTLSIER